MKDPEISAIEQAILTDPKIEGLLKVLQRLVRINREGPGGTRGAGFVPDESVLSDGFPLADARLLPDDIEQLQGRFSRFVGVLLEKDPKAIDEIVRFYTDGKVFRGLLSGVLAQEYQFPHEFGGPEPVVLLAANEALRWLLDPLREHAERTDLFRKWIASYCPVCGAAPHLCSIEGEDGRLFLSCSRCSARWKFRRMTCPFCGEAGKEKTRYFTAEDDPIHRVYVCETCKHYLKSVDLREKPIVFPRLEDIISIRLDVVAKREGYLRDTVDFVSVLAMGA
jgi:FdhE protein